MSHVLNRRLPVAAVPAVVAATIMPAAVGGERDAKLLALRPVWLVAHAAFQATFDPLAEAEKLTWAKLKASPSLDRAAVENETGYTLAQDNQSRACDEEWEIVDRIFEIPATTSSGIRFKLEIQKAFEGCEAPWMESGIKCDLLNMVGVYDA